MHQETKPFLDPDDKIETDRVRRDEMGHARPNENDGDPRTGGGKKPEKVEDRPIVGQVKPGDYPAQDRADSAPDPKINP